MLNIFDTQTEAQAAKDYDYLCKKEFDRLNAIESDTLLNWEKYYNISAEWGALKETLTGKWTYQVCPKTDRTYNTIEHSEDLFPQEEEE